MIRKRNDHYLRLERAIDKCVGAPVLAMIAALDNPRRVNRPGPSAEAARILLIKLHGIGNLVMLLPAIRRLRARYPAARIDFLTFENNQSLLRAVDEVDEIFTIDRTSLRTVTISILRMLPGLHNRGYDLVIDFEQFAYISAILTLALRSPRRIGFLHSTHRRHLAYTTPVVYAETEHMADIFARLTQAAGAIVDGAREGGIRLSPTAQGEATQLLASLGISGEDIVILLHPGSSPNLTMRRWPAERFAVLGDRLVREHGVRVILTGGEEEAELAEAVRRRMACPADNAAGRLSLMGFAALCGTSELVVANDTAAVHMASAVGTPVAGIYGPNTPFLYGPRGGADLVFYERLPCSPCLKNLNRKTSTCGQAVCIEAISAEQVHAAIRRRYFDTQGALLPRFKRDRPPARHRPDTAGNSAA